MLKVTGGEDKESRFVRGFSAKGDRVLIEVGSLFTAKETARKSDRDRVVHVVCANMALSELPTSSTRAWVLIERLVPSLESKTS